MSDFILNEQDDTSKLIVALIKAQSFMSGAKLNKVNPFHKSKYADLSSVFEAIREPLADNGLCISQIMDVLPNGRMLLKTMLMHTSGQKITSSMILPDISDPQKLGGAITYFRRYSLLCIAGIPAEDDDGNAASSYVDKKYLKEKAAIARQKKVEPLKLSGKVGAERAVSIEKQLKHYPEYHLQIQEFLTKNKMTIAGLEQEFGNRIEAKLKSLEEKQVQELRQAHG